MEDHPAVSSVDASAGELKLFLEARAIFQAYLVARKELAWRVDRYFKPTDAYTRAAARLVRFGVGTFLAWVDECAALRAEARGQDVFQGVPATGGWMDMFCGRVCEVQTRVGRWCEEFRPPEPKRRRKRGEPPIVVRVALLDCTLLRDLRLRAREFMVAVRRLPHFQDSWNRDEEITVIGRLLRVRRGPLNDAERKFEFLLAKAASVLGKRRLASPDECAVHMCIRRLFPPDVSHTISEFAGSCSGEFVLHAGSDGASDAAP